MPVNPAIAPNAPPPHTVLELIVDAMIEVGIASPGDPPDGDVVQWALRKYNYLLNFWAAKKNFVYSTSFQVFNLVAGLSPHTIGPNNATFNVPQRPVKIESWALILNSGQSAVDLPHKPLRDNDWWAMQRVKAIQTNIPTDLYYSPDQPNGSLFFWPVPNAVLPVRLELWSLVSEALSINDPIDGAGGVGTLPPAYRTAIMLTLAETLQPGARKDADSTLAAMALAARAAVFGNNTASPRIATRDSGMPGSRRGGGFNWLTGDLT
jgi:hypothetical protein